MNKIFISIILFIYLITIGYAKTKILEKYVYTERPSDYLIIFCINNYKYLMCSGADAKNIIQMRDKNGKPIRCK